MQLAVLRVDYTVPRADFAALARLVEAAREMRDAETLEVIADYLGRLSHVTGLDRSSFAVAQTLYALTTASWVELTA